MTPAIQMPFSLPIARNIKSNTQLEEGTPDPGLLIMRRDLTTSVLIKQTKGSKGLAHHSRTQHHIVAASIQRVALSLSREEKAMVSQYPYGLGTFAWN